MRYSCKNCDKQFDIYSTYYSHIKRHLPPTKRCEFCDTSFYCNQDRYRHVGKYHRPNTTAKQPVEVVNMPQRSMHTVERPASTSLVPAMFR
jgi:hypothetical protein